MLLNMLCSGVQNKLSNWDVEVKQEHTAGPKLTDNFLLQYFGQPQCVWSHCWCEVTMHFTAYSSLGLTIA